MTFPVWFVILLILALLAVLATPALLAVFALCATLEMLTRAYTDALREE